MSARTRPAKSRDVKRYNSARARLQKYKVLPLIGVGLIPQRSSNALAQTGRLPTDRIPVHRRPAFASVLQVLKFAKDLAIEQLQVEEVGCLGETGQMRHGVKHGLIFFHLSAVSTAHPSVSYAQQISFL